MEAMLETPSRVWRRIQDIEGRDMPSLPSLPPFEDSDDPHEPSYDDSGSSDDILDNGLLHIRSPMTSTPAATVGHNTAASTIRRPSSTSSAARFAASVASRSTKSSLIISASRSRVKNGAHESFDVSIIPSLPHISVELEADHFGAENLDEESSKRSVPDIYVPEEHDSEGLSLADALQSVSRSGSPYAMEPFKENAMSPSKDYDYSVSLKSEKKFSPFERFRNVALRRPASAQTRTPSLSRTSSSGSSPVNSTPRSTRSLTIPLSNPQSPVNPNSIPLPRSATASPAVMRPVSRNGVIADAEYGTSMQSMDITNIHIVTAQSADDGRSEDDMVDNQEEDMITADEKEQSGTSEGEQEPTFSSDGGPTPSYLNSPHAQIQSPAPRGTLSSPALSEAFTPTPAFPRRTRFAVSTVEEGSETPRASVAEDHTSDQEFQDEEDPTSLEDPLTPHTRRKSFLLSVINSTTRPRLKFPTPHPRHAVQLTAPDSATIKSTPAPQRVRLQTAFAGVTPRPRPGTGRLSRLSHPLVQGAIPAFPTTSELESHSPVPSTSGSGSGNAPTSVSSTSNRLAPRRASLGVPVSESISPYNGAADHASFVSTASSHDLTTHHRVNTSFDPAMGFGVGGGQGVGRFNAGKLNNYLHGLNRRLQEENEVLLERLRQLEEGREGSGQSHGESLSVGSSEGNSRRLSAGGSSRRVSMGATVLGDVEEDAGAERWMEEKVALEDIVEALRDEVTQCVLEKEELAKTLIREQEERARDKERWRERMVEVEKGVEGIIKDLEVKAETAEQRVKELEDESERQLQGVEKRLTEAEAERDDAVEQAGKARRALESGKELGGELRDANERLGKVTTDLRNANAQIQQLENEVVMADTRIDHLERDAQEDKAAIDSLEQELNGKVEVVEAYQNKVGLLEQEAKQAKDRLEALTAYAAELEEGAGQAVERMESLEDDLAAANEKIEVMSVEDEEFREKILQLEADGHRAQEVAREMEEALGEAERKMKVDEEEIHNLRTHISSLERERQREVSILEESSRNPFAPVGPSEADLEALENELDAANREIAKLNGLLKQSPARKAMEKAREAKMEMLEREKEELLERNKALRMAMNEINTPSKVINASGISPIHRHVLSMSMRGPKTPGAPLGDMSWLHNVSSDPTVSPLVAEIKRLQRELDFANQSIDDKLDKLEDAGQGVVGLTRKLEDARSRISELEEELARLTRREERRLQLLEWSRCQKCHTKVNFTKLTSQLDQSSIEISQQFQDDLPTEPPTPPTRTTELLRADLKSVNVHLESLRKRWESEKCVLLQEKTVLQDAAHRLNIQVQQAKDDLKKAERKESAGERAMSSVQGELAKAKQIISDLEANLKTERAQLRSLMTEQSSIEREKNDVLRQLQRTESDMDDVKQQLQKYKRQNHDLEKELRENANVEQKARLLENRVAENAETICNLRQERSLLVTDHRQLQQRFAGISEQADELRKRYESSFTTHENRRQQLDLHVTEIGDLRRALSDQANDLQKAEIEKDRAAAEKNDVAKIVAVLEDELRRVKKNAEAFGRDLKLLRAEKEKQETTHKEEFTKLERTKKQTQTQIRLLNEQLDSQRKRAESAEQQLTTHVCAADEKTLSTIKLQHNKECKGLIVQIRYLKAKFTREHNLRSGLVYQKNYLLVLLSQFERSEQNIFASIAQIGFPIAIPDPTRKAPRLKSVALVVVFLSRTKRISDLWREQSSSKEAVAAALQDVRRRRTES